MENYDIIVETILNRILGNFIWMAIMAAILTYVIKLIKELRDKIKEKKYVRMDKYFSNILVSIILIVFTLYFFILLSVNAKTGIMLIRDNKVQQVETKEIDLEYSKFSSKHIKFIVDEKNSYYYIPSIMNISEKDINRGSKYIISYYKYSKIICNIDEID